MKNFKIFIGIVVVLAMISTSQAQTFITNGLVGFWPFSGNANDATGHGNNGLVINAQPMTDRFGQAASAYKFNGIQSPSGSQIVITNTLLNLGQAGYTIQFWFEADNNSQASCMFSTLTNSPGLGQTGIGITYSKDQTEFVQYYIGNGTTWDLVNQGGSFNQYAVENWYCATLTKSNLVYTFYINGQQQNVRTNAAAASYNWNDGIRIGAYTVDGLEAFAGGIDDVRFYNRALSQSEIAKIYRIEAVPLVSYVKAFAIDYQNLKVGSNYVLQASANLNTWTNFGSVFTATNDTYTNTNYQRVDNWNHLFFRLQQQ